MKSTTITSISISLPSIKSLVELSKLRLSSLVVFSALIGYGLAIKDGNYEIWNILLFALGSLLITSAANGINQMIEKNLDKLMSRTALRPLPTGRMTMAQAMIFVFFLGL